VTQQYVDELVRAYPSIREVWLLGSRANNCWTEKSDWDFLVFGDDIRVMNELCQVQRKRSDIDLLFVGADGDIAVSPWTEADDYRKTLGLGNSPGGLSWRVVSDTEATYLEPADHKSEGLLDIATRFRPVKAALVYRRA
jgi:predicted nucleotidyltransferase